MNHKERHLGSSQGLQSIDGIMPGQLRFQIRRFEPKSRSGIGDAWVTRQIANRINPGETGHLVGVLGRPREGHQASTAATQQHHFWGEFAMRGEFFMERRIEHPPRRVAVGFAHVDACHSDACFEKTLKHPLLFGAWKPRQRGSIEHPRYDFPGRWRSQDKGRVATDGQHLTWQRQ